MKRFYVIFKNGKVFAVMASHFGLLLINPTMENMSSAIYSTITKSVQTYVFYDEVAKVVGQFFYEDVLCITNEKPDENKS